MSTGGPVQVLHSARHALSQHHLHEKVTMSTGWPIQVLHLVRHALSQHHLHEKVTMSTGWPIQFLHLARHALSQHHLRDKVTMSIGGPVQVLHLVDTEPSAAHYYLNMREENIWGQAWLGGTASSCWRARMVRAGQVDTEPNTSTITWI
jgi:hypothetical protein